MIATKKDNVHIADLEDLLVQQKQKTACFQRSSQKEDICKLAAQIADSIAAYRKDIESQKLNDKQDKVYQKKVSAFGHIGEVGYDIIGGIRHMNDNVRYNEQTLQQLSKQKKFLRLIKHKQYLQNKQKAKRDIEESIRIVDMHTKSLLNKTQELLKQTNQIIEFDLEGDANKLPKITVKV